MILLRIIGLSALMSVLWMLDAPSRAKIINVPCQDASGSAGWVHRADSLPPRYYPMVLLGVSQLKPGDYQSHPMYNEFTSRDPRMKYAYCAYSTSSD